MVANNAEQAWSELKLTQTIPFSNHKPGRNLSSISQATPIPKQLFMIHSQKSSASYIFFSFSISQI